jgi:hypothetical protein
MTVHADSEDEPGKGPFRRRQVKVAPPQPSQIERFKDPEAVNSQRAYGRGIYKASQVNVLLARYVRIRGDLLMAWPDVRDKGTESQKEAAIVCASLLKEARTELESRRVTLTVVAHLLSLADRALVSLYGNAVMRYRLHTLRNRLLQLNPSPKEHLKNIGLAVQGWKEDQRDQVETAVKDALSYLGEQDERALIEADLQVSRLNRALIYVTVGWVLLLAIVPFVSGVQRDAGGDVIWPVFSFEYTEWFDLLFGALGLSIVGAVGGIVSGMFSVRNSTTTLLEYRTSLKRMALKPMVGAVAALTLYFFLGANVIAGVAITTAGTYVVAAFLAGFSERYFLRFLDRASEATQTPQHTGRTEQSPDTLPVRSGADLNLITSD